MIILYYIILFYCVVSFIYFVESMVKGKVTCTGR